MFYSEIRPGSPFACGKVKQEHIGVLGKRAALLRYVLLRLTCVLLVCYVCV